MDLNEKITVCFPELGNFSMQSLKIWFHESYGSRVLIPRNQWKEFVNAWPQIEKLERPDYYPAETVKDTMMNFYFIKKFIDKESKIELTLDRTDTTWVGCNNNSLELDLSKDLMISFLKESTAIESLNFKEASLIAPLFKRSNFVYLFSDENGGCKFQGLTKDENGQPYTSGSCSISKTEKCLQYLKEVEKEDEMLKSINFLANLISKYKEKTDADELDFSMREK